MPQELCVIVGAEDCSRFGRDRRRSEPAAGARAAGPDRPVLGGSAVGSRFGTARRREPAGGVALAVALRQAETTALGGLDRLTVDNPC